MDDSSDDDTFVVIGTPLTPYAEGSKILLHFTVFLYSSFQKLLNPFVIHFICSLF